MNNSPRGPHIQAMCKSMKGGVHSSCQLKSPNYSRRLLIGPTVQADEMSHMAGSAVVADLKLLMDNSKSKSLIGIKEEEFESSTSDILSKMKVVQRYSSLQIKI